MAETEYPDDVQFAGLVQAATAAADEQTRNSRLGKRKRAEDDEANIDPSMTNDETNLNLQHSAAVLFREPSAKSKKYSRPPLGKVYTSLELAPENFLKLQSAAKDFMLDPAYPERKNVVGHRRHSGGTDVAKLKLWNCVEQFLRDEGNGDRFFGEGVGEGIPGAPERTMSWPADSQKIIRLCMPLMRKMVTNERQRIYAAESRKPKIDQELEEEVHIQQEGQFDQNSAMNAKAHEENAAGSVFQEPSIPQPPRIPLSQPLSDTSVVLLINLMSLENGSLRRVVPRFSVNHESAANLRSLREEVKKRSKSTSGKRIDNATIKVWMADGLVQVKDDGEWMVALLSAGLVEWMDGEVRVLVEL